MRESPVTLAQRLAAEPLPPMRRTLTRVRDLLDTPNASHTALARLIGTDPGFSLHIFSRLGALPNQPKQPITKIENAIPLLGMHAISQAAHSLPSLEDRLQGVARRGLLHSYSQAAHAAIYASELASCCGLHDPQGFNSSALLNGLGEMALWLAEPELIRSIRQQIQQGVERERAYRDQLGFPPEALDQALGRLWGLPEPIQVAQDLSNSHLRAPLLVMLANTFARSSSHGWQHRGIEEIMDLLADFQALTVDRSQARLRQLAVHAARELQGLTLPLPAYHLLFVTCPPVAPVKPSAQALEASATTAAMASQTKLKPRPQTPLQDKLQAQAQTRVQPKPQPQPQVQTQPTAMPKTRNQAKIRTTATPRPTENPLQESLLLTINEMQLNQGLPNVMFATLSKDRAILKARYAVEEGDSPRLKGFEIDLNRPSLFAALMKKPQAIWLNAGNLVKYLPMIPEDVIQNLNARGFLSMSLFIKDRPIGLFYADNGRGNLTAEQFANFKVLCQRFARQFT